MKIGIHATLTGTHAGGPETYIVGLIKGLASIDNKNEYVIFISNSEVQKTFDLPPNFSFCVLKPASRWIEIPISFPLSLVGKHLDCVHLTYMAPPICPGKMVFTIHDISPFTHPQFYPLGIRLRAKFLLKSGIRNAEHFCCVSEVSKKELMEKFTIPEKKISITYNGIDSRYKQLDKTGCMDELKKKYPIKKNFILFVGKIQNRKNLARLLNAYSKLLINNDCDCDLILVGQITWLSEEILTTINKLGLANRVIMTGHVDDEDLILFYNACEIFVFPSLYEGFGIPPLEAMACGTPVAVSNAFSLPEVVGDAGLIFNPLDIQEIYNCMKQLLDDKKLRADLISKGLKRAKLFNWKDTAKRTLSVYQTLTNNSS